MAEPVPTECYFSCDVEADGPIPGDYSLVSVGMCVAGRLSAENAYLPADPSAETFYAELRPISEQWVPEALAVSGLTRDHLVERGEPPEGAMTRLAAWVRETSAGAAPCFVAYPLGFDWMWTYWYLRRYSESGSPFSHGDALDIKTLFAAKWNRGLTRSGKRYIPPKLHSTREHTHNALDDAIGQAELFSNLRLA